MIFHGEHVGYHSHPTEAMASPTMDLMELVGIWRDCSGRAFLIPLASRVSNALDEFPAPLRVSMENPSFPLSAIFIDRPKSSDPFP